MKIRAIRLKEVGRFRDPIALEGLTGELDVLAGPNELGKSTILKAVKLALFEKHTSAKKDIEAVRPYSGGAPLIEVDLEVDGRLWRLRKQYMSGRAAELKELPSGAIARGGDAETELAKLLTGSSDAQRLELLWVDQGTSLAAVKPAGKARGALLTAIEGEVETVADGAVARAVQACVKQELAALVTSHSPPRPTGRYKQAREELQSLEGQREVARSRLAAAEARLERLQQVRAEIAKLADHEAATRRAKAAQAATKALEDAKLAREKYRQAEAALSTQDARCHAMKAALEGLNARIVDLGKQEEAAARETPQRAELERSVAEQEARVRELRKRRDEIKSALAAAEEERKALELAGRLAEVRERLRKARAAAGEQKSLSEAMAANGADDAMLKAVRRETGSIATINARLSAAAPAVTVAYARGGKDKIKVEGRPLKHGEMLNPTRALVLDIEGVGTVTIAPGQSEGLAEDEADLKAHEQSLAELLCRVGVATADEAEQRAVERREIEGKLAEAAADLKALAPDGVARLEQAETQLAARAKPVEVPERPVAELEVHARDLADALAEAETQLNELMGAHGEARDALVRLRARSEDRRERIANELAELGDAEARAVKRKAQADALAAAELERNAAIRDLAAWREAAPDAERFAALQEAAKSAEAARSETERKLSELRRAEAGIEGELKADRADDVEARLAELDETVARAKVRVADMDEEIAALQLLHRELDAAADATREHLAKPVIARLAPFLELVFPEARARFGEGLALDKLERSGASEDIARLSEGTQEQLAVLVRLGFGRLLAERGAPVPLILDDALVYADDRRIEQMFDALKLAARNHQVLVLTCRERTFASLGGNRVAISAWQPD